MRVIRGIFAIVTTVILLTGGVQAAPRMTISDSLFDFGYVPQNAKVAHVFWLHSTGDDTLKIIKVNPG
ncbi:MAG: hypothetical protein KAU35_08780 [candidate division Zixibacteria bacterium]|nr:hypothetical protein [candidate division Zixibacteria bacterium]